MKKLGDRLAYASNAKIVLAGLFDTKTAQALFRGESGLSGPVIARWIRVTVTATILIANIVGAGVVYVLASWVIPVPRLPHSDHVRIVNLISLAAYGVFAFALGIIWGNRRFGVSKWVLHLEHTPTEAEQREVLRAPFNLVSIPAVLWGLATVLFGAINATFSWELARVVVSTTVLGGITTCTVTYLLSERCIRPAAAKVLESGKWSNASIPGVTSRTLLGWGLGTGLPVLGLVLVGVTSLTGVPVSAKQLSYTIIGLGGLAVVVGFLVTLLIAGSTADPILSMSQAIRKVEQGDLDCAVPVYDGTEIGILQAGFNRMIGGLKEREKIRDLFGRHVGEDVARAALDGEIELGGELREVTVLFVDLIASTELAASRPPQEVVAIINRFLGIVVRHVDENGGWVNKFEGDAALAIFGAPLDLDDPYGRALTTARLIAAELSETMGDNPAAIGVASGLAVAGNIGDIQRYEYTVIGDPVNQAARLTELAKSHPCRVLASETVVASSNSVESARWTLGDSVVLRGRNEPTRLATPSG